MDLAGKSVDQCDSGVCRAMQYKSIRDRRPKNDLRERPANERLAGQAVEVEGVDFRLVLLTMGKV